MMLPTFTDVQSVYYRVIPDVSKDFGKSLAFPDGLALSPKHVILFLLTLREHC